MKRIGRPPKVTKELISKIADCFLCAFTDQQTADLCGINEKTIRRIRLGSLCPEIKNAELNRELAYRKKIWNAKGYWQGAAWFLERKYPTQFAKPEIQLAINTTNQTVNNTLIITAEAASAISDRYRAADSKVEQLFKEKKANATLLPPKAKNGNGNHDT